MTQPAAAAGRGVSFYEKVAMMKMPYATFVLWNMPDKPREWTLYHLAAGLFDAQEVAQRKMDNDVRVTAVAVVDLAEHPHHYQTQILCGDWTPKDAIGAEFQPELIRRLLKPYSDRL